MLTKILGVISILGIVCSLFSFILYQSTKIELTSLQSKYTQSQSLLKDCSDSKVKLEDSNKVSEEVLVDQQEKLIELEEGKQTLLDQLKTLPKKCTKPTVNTNNVTGTPDENDQVEYVDIDAPFASDYLGVFKQLSKDKGSSNSP